MYKVLDIESWDRKRHYEFFKDFEEPFFGITANVEVTKAYRKCKREKQSFFIYYLYAACKAANTIEAFKYRIEEDGRVIIHESINASSTINRPDGTFGFSYIDFDNDFESFKENAQREIDRVRSKTDLVPSSSASNTIHFSTLPWIKFTSISHARRFSFKESIPKISFGKLFEENNRLYLPISIHVHHSLMDGYHVGKFLEMMEEILKQ